MPLSLEPWQGVGVRCLPPSLIPAQLSCCCCSLTSKLLCAGQAVSPRGRGSRTSLVSPTGPWGLGQAPSHPGVVSEVGASSHLAPRQDCPMSCSAPMSPIQLHPAAEAKPVIVGGCQAGGAMEPWGSCLAWERVPHFSLLPPPRRQGQLLGRGQAHGSVAHRRRQAGFRVRQSAPAAACWAHLLIPQWQQEWDSHVPCSGALLSFPGVTLVDPHKAGLNCMLDAWDLTDPGP